MFFSHKRILTHEVSIGDLKMGGNNPIRIQSMTTTDTMDTEGTVKQTLKMVEAGCELVRITAPSIKEAENLRLIKAALHKQGCYVPLVADIHFTPNAAEVAARIVEKVRVNPGNYADKKKFETIDYTDSSYQAELERIYKKFAPLVKICKERGTCMRIGTNHGSLSDRILSRYGDSPLGMVESAWEFIQICEDFNFHNIVISMKASNPQVMVQAYRMLMDKMLKHTYIYPLHLGVTEAGEGEDGRIKSALGIATLLMDGIGDTVRVSLTEEPEYESPVAKFLIDYYEEMKEEKLEMKNEIRNEKLEMKNDEGVEEMKNEKEERIKEKGTEEIKNGNEGIHLRNPLSSAEICVPEKLPFNPYQFNRRKTAHILNIGQIEVPRVVGDIRHACGQVADLKEMGYDYNALLDKYNFADISADFVYLGKNIPPFEMPGGLKLIYDAQTWELLRENDRQFPYFSDINAFFTTKKRHNSLNFVKITKEDIPVLLAQKEAVKTCVFIADSEAYIPTYDFRRIIYALTNADLHNPILAMSRKHEDYGFYDDSYFPENVQINEESKIQLSLSADLSTLLVDGLIEGVWIEKADNLMLRTIFGCLQMSRLRITKTEYISCPSCGRTLFDLMETTARIRSRTEHLKGVKIGIMGCIVNGPGEMADADYGYVGVGTDKIALYRGKEVVMKAVKTAEAVDKLIDLIREDGRWVE